MTMFRCLTSMTLRRICSSRLMAAYCRSNWIFMKASWQITQKAACGCTTKTAASTELKAFMCGTTAALWSATEFRWCPFLKLCRPSVLAGTTCNCLRKVVCTARSYSTPAVWPRRKIYHPRPMTPPMVTPIPSQRQLTRFTKALPIRPSLSPLPAAAIWLLLKLRG